MKPGVGVFPEVLCCSPSAGTELRLLLLSEPPLHCRDFSWGRFLGFSLALAEIEQKLWVYVICWERISTAGAARELVRAGTGWSTGGAPWAPEGTVLHEGSSQSPALAAALGQGGWAGLQPLQAMQPGRRADG